MESFQGRRPGQQPFCSKRSDPIGSSRHHPPSDACPAHLPPRCTPVCRDVIPRGDAPLIQRDIARRAPRADSPRPPCARRGQVHEPMVSSGNPGADRSVHLHDRRARVGRRLDFPFGTEHE
ncbi:hypothetical protein T484DRAFT_1955179 [Baffinella frigidus]|nr:hypothetical protein T484DRAFT_1955179 [Cryptophyta sp. CCMP2293]